MKTTKLQFDSSIVSSFQLGDLDLVAIPMAETIANLQNKNIDVYYMGIGPAMIPTNEEYEKFSAMEEIVFSGYPRGLYNETEKISIIRKGVTATPIWNNFRGEGAFLIDAGAFHGASGSPVFICKQEAHRTRDGFDMEDKLFFAGIISQTMIRDNTTGKGFVNLAKVINSKTMYQEVEKFIHR